MPTENRPSNTEMVSVPRYMAEEISAALISHGHVALPRGLQEAMNARADHHQGEPVALPSCKARLSESHDWDQGYRDGWNACLDEIAKLGPLYTHADTGEVERLQRRIANADLALKAQTQNCETLRAQLAEQKQIIEALCEGTDGSTPALLTIGRLQTQLAERDALLQRTLPYLSNTPDLVQHGAEDLAEEIRSTSAGKPCYGPNEWGTECGKCGKCKTASAEPISGTPLAQLTEAKRLLHTASTSLARWLGQNDDPRKQIIAFLEGCAEPINDLCADGAHEFVPFRSECVKCGEPYSAEPSAERRTTGSDFFETAFGSESSAPVERDERADFEDWCRKEHVDPKSHKGADSWEGWRARAALERKP